jgi:ABC-type iron transport system FetAB permease component
MKGAIFGGSSVDQAAKLQMIIMFMIAAAALLASLFITFTAIIVVVDQEHQIRSDRIDNSKKPVIYRVKD